MIFNDFKGKKISMLGYGAMRFPTVERDGRQVVDIDAAEQLVDRAMEAGINYYDTAWPYHGGESERIIGKLLSKYPRESYYLANKFPGHQIMEDYHPAAIFEEQLKKCGVKYFDFYLLHNVYENSIPTYLDERWGIIDYFLEQKRLGRIKHLGFSTHASVESLADFLDRVGEHMEFCQIQLNYLDATLQRANEKCKILNERNIPIWVMEPVRGGRLAKLPDSAEARLRELHPERSTAAWGFRWLKDVEGVTVVLSGMSNMEQLEDNIATMSDSVVLTDGEKGLLLEIAEGLKSAVPCTACRYCTDGCPAELDIPKLLSVYNEIKVMPSVMTAMQVEFLPDDKKPTACIGCGKCSNICPQKIDIPTTLASLSDMLGQIPSWREICRKRDEEQARGRK